MRTIEDYKNFPYKLDSCVWEVTLACCFRCAYCGSGGGVARKDELDTDECLAVSEQLSLLGCRRVNLIGGEVFMRPDWREIVDSLSSKGIKVCIITNGFKMSTDIISDLKRLKIESVAVSIDGTSDVHDSFRQKGSYLRARDTVISLAKGGIPVSVISALRADNAPRIAEFYETLKSLPIFAWQLQACSPMGNAGKNKLDVSFDAYEVIKFVYNIAPVAPFVVGIADNIGYFTPEEGSLRGVRRGYFTGCSAGLSTVGIDSVGNVRGCESMYDSSFNEGNLREKTLIDIWTDPDAFSYNRKFTHDMLGGKCVKCEYGDVCAGGCRSYNFFTSGNLYSNILCAKKQ